MTTKRGTELHRTLANFEDDEPIFMIGASDRLAPVIVNLWTELAGLHNASEETWNAARRLELAMLSWQKRTGRAKWPT